MRVALYQPDIPQNVAAVARLAACFGVPLDVIGPEGFVWDARRMRRVGMDYLAAAEIVRHPGWESFRAHCAGRLVLLSTRGATPLPGFAFRADDVLLFGRESAGVPEEVHAAAAARVLIPIRAETRSLNLASAAAIALAEALRQTGGFPQAK
ncbi:tRNA (cytidine(34)-2'-O)-methyltransferase [uncultured Alphaproteobacteria bacterium]|uniref:tRNA (cytidine(34)-2'-O)-methyltransferase n=1 Tax=uncultured Alphaproteobacteria bacterium TaxID=91750 RepID=A0A212JWT1_9PROT|nr:tRNA (cytidine(34)-2'-O)-methyltransferase [uncultured Alphaproteobacteria bacterium]